MPGTSLRRWARARAYRRVRFQGTLSARVFGEHPQFRTCTVNQRPGDDKPLPATGHAVCAVTIPSRVSISLPLHYGYGSGRLPARAGTGGWDDTIVNDIGNTRLLVRALGPRRLRDLLAALATGLALYGIYYALRGGWTIVLGGMLASASLLALAGLVATTRRLPSPILLTVTLAGVNAGALISIPVLGTDGLAWVAPLVFANLLLGGAVLGSTLTLGSVLLIIVLGGLYTDIDLTANILGALILSALMALAVTVSLEDHVGRLQVEANHDPLTGAVNRGGFKAILARYLARLEASRPLSLILFDLDHFKTLNDRFGHNTGDAVLQQFVEILKANLRRQDSIYRYGGEEFAVLVEGDVDAAFRVAEELRRAIAEHPFLDDYAITVSAGVAQATTRDTQRSLVGRADEALYRAKRNGRDRCERAIAGKPG